MPCLREIPDFCVPLFFVSRGNFSVMGIESLCYSSAGGVVSELLRKYKAGILQKEGFYEEEKSSTFYGSLDGSSRNTGCRRGTESGAEQPAESREETAAEPEEHLSETAAENSEEALSEDQKAADQVAAMIDAIYVRREQRTRINSVKRQRQAGMP